VASGGDPLVVLVGPPNSGKSTLFNNLTGLRQRVANFPGVTVERRSGIVESVAGPVEVIDLPGVHGLSPRSPDQVVTRNALLGELEGDRRPDAVVVVLDATRLRSHLMVAEPVLGLGLPTLVVLTMADELDRRDGALRRARLSRELGVEVALVNARYGATLEPVRRFLAALRTGGEEVRACPIVVAADHHGGHPAGRPLPVIDIFAARRERARELSRSTVGLIGVGNVGRHVIELLAGFETTILVADPYLGDDDARRPGVERVDLADLMARCDVVSIHAPANDGTRHMIDGELLGRLSDGAVLINTARGAIIDEGALVDELATGRIFAFLDVTDPEPPAPGSPLRQLENAVVTPHIAGCIDNCHRMGELAVEEVRRCLAGEPAINEVRPDMLDRLA